MLCDFPALRVAYDQLGRAMTKLSALELAAGAGTTSATIADVTADLTAAKIAVDKALSATVNWLSHIPVI